MINQQFAFAVHIVTALAFDNVRMDSRELAESVNTNPVVVRRLLLALRRAKLVETQPGKNGGAKLRKKLSEISLFDIYRAVKPRPVIAVNHRRPARDCAVSCQMKSIMTQISAGTERTLQQHLRQITIDQLLRKVRRECGAVLTRRKE